MYCVRFSHITSFCTQVYSAISACPMLSLNKSSPFLTTEDLPLESYSGSKAEEPLAHLLSKPMLSKCSYNRHLDWALRFGAWEEFKVIKNTYH